MSSTGQIVGGVVGGIVGAFAGVPMLGASIGMSIGGYIDPPKGPKIEGPRLGDLTVQTATYGAQIPRVYGSIATFGNIFWVENNQLKETATTESQGKGGGGGAETTLYSYSATFALGLCSGPIAGIRRIWCGGKLIYDAGSSDIGAIVSSEVEGGGNFTLYLGTDDQLPDPRMQAVLGVGNTPAYRGLAYIVFNDFPLAEYGNSLMGAQFKVEVLTTASFTNTCDQTGTLSFHSAPDGLPILSTVRYADERFYCSSLIYNSFDTALIGVSRQDLYYTNPVSSAGSLVAINPYEPGIGGGNSVHPTIQSDEDILFVSRGVSIHNNYGFLGFSASGDLVLDTYYLNTSFLPEANYRFVVDRGDIFTTYDGLLYKFGKTIYPAPVDVSVSSEDFNSRAFGASENYLFMVVNNGSTTATTVKKVSRETLETVETLTISVDSRWASITVVSDSVFYLMSGVGNNLRKYDSGVFADTGMVYTGPRDFSFVNNIRFFVISDRMAVFFADAWGGHANEVYTCRKVISGGVGQLDEIIEAECGSSGLLNTTDIDVSLINQAVRGYKVTQTAAIRAALEPLQAAWPFDVIQSGYKVKFVPRGQSPVATISADELGAVAGNEKPGVRVTRSREMDAQLPRRVNATYLDVNREYDVGTGPGAERLNTDAVSVTQIELAIVMNATECAGVEETLLYLYWLERNDVSIVLPPSYSLLQPADVITVVENSATYELRLTDINYLPDGRLECSAKLNNATIYSPTAVGEEGASVGQVLTYAGPTELVLLDIPRGIDTQDSVGMPFAMFGYASGWKGGVLIRSDDMGASYQTVAASNNAARIFIAEGVLDDSLPYAVDQCSTLTVRALIGTSEIYGITETQLYAHANLAAFGADGRWEILAFQAVSDLGSGRYTISRMLRGLYGTEQNTGNHQVGDWLVMLDISRLAYCGMPSSSLGLPRIFRAVTDGKAIDSAYDISQIYTGNNFKPLAPVDLKTASTPTSGDWLLEWKPRTRTPVELFSGVSVPLGEASEAYEVDVLSADWNTVKRTYAGLASPSATITLAEQTADFGDEQTALNLDIYQVSATVGRGHRYRAIARRNGWEGEFAPWIVSGLHFNGANNSTVFNDTVPGRVWTAGGNAKLSTDAGAFGGISGNFDGVGDYIYSSAGLEFTPSIDTSWCICGFVEFYGGKAQNGIVSTLGSATTQFGWTLYHVASGYVAFTMKDASSNSHTVVGPALTYATRGYVAVAKIGRTYRVYVNGIGGAPVTINVPIYTAGVTDFRYGRYSSYNPEYDFAGRLDDWRIFMGNCPYSDNFTPPFEPFVDR